MTGTQLEFDVISGASNLVFNDTIVDVLHKKMEELGGPTFSEDEREFARELSKTFPGGGGVMESMVSVLGPDGKQLLKDMKEALLYEGILPAFKKDIAMPGSTDVGDVSWVTPTGQIVTSCQAVGTPGHSWQAVAQSGMSIGHKGMIYAGKVLALTALEFMRSPEVLKAAKDELNSRLEKTPFVALIPKGTKPPFG